MNKTPSGDKIDRQSYLKMKAKEVATTTAAAPTAAIPPTSGGGSPGTLERKNRRFSYANSRYYNMLLLMPYSKPIFF